MVESLNWVVVAVFAVVGVEVFGLEFHWDAWLLPLSSLVLMLNCLLFAWTSLGFLLGHEKRAPNNAVQKTLMLSTNDDCNKLNSREKDTLGIMRVSLD